MRLFLIFLFGFFVIVSLNTIILRLSSGVQLSSLVEPFVAWIIITVVLVGMIYENIGKGKK